MSSSVPLGVSKRPPTVKGVAPQKNRRGGILNYPLPSEKRGAAEKEGRGSFKAQGLPPSWYSCGVFGGRETGGSFMKPSQNTPVFFMIFCRCQ